MVSTTARGRSSAYTTVKKCQIVDAKIALSHKAVMLGVLTYIVVNLILSHGYMKQEAPSAVVNAYVDEADYYAYVATLASDPPAYCDNPDTDYTYSASWTYEDNGCDFSLRLGDVLTKTESAVFITTYFQDTPVDAASANAAGLYASNAFVPGVDQMRLVFDHQVSTTWGDVVGNPAIEFRRRGGGGEQGGAPEVPGQLGGGHTPRRLAVDRGRGPGRDQRRVGRVRASISPERDARQDQRGVR